MERKPDWNKEALSNPKRFSCIMSGEIADIIHKKAQYYGVSDGQALEHLISVNNVSDPKLASVLSIMHIEHAIKYQCEKNQILAMSVIAGTLIGEIVNTGKYTLDEAISEAVKNINTFRQIIDDMKKEKDED